MLSDECGAECTRCAGKAPSAEAAIAPTRAEEARGREWRRGALLADLRDCPTCSVERAAEALSIGRSTAYAAARDGSLPTIRLSHRLLVPTAKLLAMLGLEQAE